MTTDDDRPGDGTGGGEELSAAERERLRRRPLRQFRETEVHQEAAQEIAAQRTRPWHEPEYTRPSAVMEAVTEIESEHTDPAAMRRAERAVNLLFAVSILGTAGFCFGYVYVPNHTSSFNQMSHIILGSCLTLSLMGLGAAFVVWAKRLLPHEEAVQEREPMHSPEEEELLTEELFLRGADEMGLPRRKFMRRLALFALGVFPFVLLFPLRDLGPLPGRQLRRSGWRKNIRLVNLDTGEPVRMGDLEIGGMMTVMPEGFTDVNDLPLAPTILIRLPPGGNAPNPNPHDWAVDDHVAYNKICTHAGCPVSLYEQQRHQLLCPCHQSTFDVPRGCKVVFGPAAHPLPQLPIYLDSQGYFRAQSDFLVPPGPNFWERG